jgi:hypothetical protein
MDFCKPGQVSKLNVGNALFQNVDHTVLGLGLDWNQRRIRIPVLPDVLRVPDASEAWVYLFDH